MKTIDIVITVVIALAVIFALWRIFKKRKSGCSCGCAECECKCNNAKNDRRDVS